MDLTIASAQLDRLSSLYSRVEGKSSTASGLSFGLLTIFLLNLGDLQYLSEIWVLIPTFLYLATTTTSLIWGYRVHFPHLSGAPINSAIYFADIAKLECHVHSSNLKNMGNDQLLDDLYAQIWRNSKILSFKFKVVEQQFQLLAVSIPFWIWSLICLISTSNSDVLKVS